MSKMYQRPLLGLAATGFSDIYFTPPANIFTARLCGRPKLGGTLPVYRLAGKRAG
jgi:hypothetical protein